MVVDRLVGEQGFGFLQHLHLLSRVKGLLMLQEVPQVMVEMAWTVTTAGEVLAVLVALVVLAEVVQVLL